MWLGVFRGLWSLVVGVNSPMIWYFDWVSFIYVAIKASFIRLKLSLKKQLKLYVSCKLVAVFALALMTSSLAVSPKNLFARWYQNKYTSSTKYKKKGGTTSIWGASLVLSQTGCELEQFFPPEAQMFSFQCKRVYCFQFYLISFSFSHCPPDHLELWNMWCYVMLFILFYVLV